MSRIKFFDATLRDGNHAVKHQLTQKNIQDHCQYMDASGVYAIIIGHGNGIGASSLQVGLAKLTSTEMFEAAQGDIKKAKMGTYMIPGFGTIRDDIDPAIACGTELFKIGCHCTEADTTREHIEYLAGQNKEVYGVLMMYHMASVERLLEEARKMKSYGACGVILMDSAGSSTPERVRQTITTLVDGLDMEIGFHAHNNLGLAVSNTYIAIKNGARIVDGTIRGFGAGAGNCQLEALAALLAMENIDCGLDVFRMMDASEKVVKHFRAEDKGLDDLSIVNGMAGTFSAFKSHVIKASEEFDVDPRRVLLELGRRKTVGGQEDMIVEVAEQLSHAANMPDESFFLASLS